MEILPVATYHCGLEGKFGLPRQAGLAPSLRGVVRLTPPYRNSESLRGLDGFDWCHLIWGFSLNDADPHRMTVRPPRLGGNERIGVFASRSPFRPNGLGLSSVRIEGIDTAKGLIFVSGADLADGTPVYDIKPYVEYCDAHTGIRSGFVDANAWKPLEVIFEDSAAEALEEAQLDDSQIRGLAEILAQDPRPQYHSDPERVYTLSYCGFEVSWRVAGNTAFVVAARSSR